MTDMSRQANGGRGDARGDGGEFARGAGFAAAKGAALIAFAIVVGVVLLQVVDDGSTGPVASDDTRGSTTTTEATAPNETTTTTAATPPKTPDQLRVLVLNSGAPAGSARAMRDALVEKGYSNQGTPADDDTTRPDTAVMCRSGLDREAAALAVAVGDGTVTEAFRDPPPPNADAEQAECVVLVGSTVSTNTTSTEA
jgi:hypothetical protein